MASDRHRPAFGRRHIIIRRGTCGLTFAVAVLYLVLLLLVRQAEAGRSENTYGAYLYLALSYLAGGVLLARLDTRLAYLLGAAVQTGVLVLFLLFGVGVFGPGLFEYQVLARLHMAVWAAVITGAEVVLLGSLSYLALTASVTPRGTADPSGSRRADRRS